MNFQEAVRIITDQLQTSDEEATTILEKAESGGEIGGDTSVQNWVDNRLLPNCVAIDEEGYAHMCVDALKILSNTAGTDYGGSRQRDLAQLWADMTRGYLGELAFLEFLEQKKGIRAQLGHEVGRLKDFLPLDIHSVQLPGQEARQPRIKISIKTTKWNGIWLDIPGDQFSHSDVHVLVKVGAGRAHLFAFFKALSVFKDKVLKRGEEVGALTSVASQQLFDSLPTFKPINAYICGFVRKDHEYHSLSYAGKSGRKNYKVTSWNGPMETGDLEKIRQREGISGTVEFEGIGRFGHDRMYLFNAGNLLWKDTDWTKVIESL
jgi:hypothetical protein